MKVTVVTPSLNQGRYIERTIRSVLSQEGPFTLQYLVMDGGSTDGTLDILRRYEGRLVWRSERDRGQSDAINKGFHLAEGEILAWLNSDDEYVPGALSRVVREYQREPFEWCFGNCRIIDSESAEIRRLITRYKMWQSRHYSYRRLLRRLFIPQPSTFFTRAGFEAVGDLNCDLHYTMDYDYWLRLGRRSPPRYLDDYLACFRWHKESKNGALYARAAKEAYATARRFAPPGSGFDLFMHFCHYVTLNVVYRVW